MKIMGNFTEDKLKIFLANGNTKVAFDSFLESEAFFNTYKIGEIVNLGYCKGMIEKLEYRPLADFPHGVMHITILAELKIEYKGE